MLKITEEEIVNGEPTRVIPGAVWLGNIYGEDDDWRIFAVPIRSPMQRFIEVDVTSDHPAEAQK